MAENSNIEWTHHSFNPWWGCTKVSSGCQFCYADAFARGRFKLNVWGPTADRKPASEATWKEPAKWNRQAEAAGERHRVFCASMADVFEGPETCQNPEAYKVIRAARRRLLNEIAMTPHLDWLLLTKRPQHWRAVLEEIKDDDRAQHSAGGLLAIKWLKGEAPANVWIGTSVENQQAADERIPHLLEIPAKVRFLSCEPLLGPVDIQPWVSPRSFGDLVELDKRDRDAANAAKEVFAPVTKTIQLPSGEPYTSAFIEPVTVNWVICGGESGPHARPMHPDWARGLRDQCQAAGVAFFHKQNGEWLHQTDSEWATGDTIFYVNHPDDPTGFHKVGTRVRKVGKKAAGRLLDGRTWDELPEVAL